MCFAAIHWARIARVVYGASIADAKRFGFNELMIPNVQMKEMGGAKIEIVPGVMRDESVGLFELWAHERGHKAY
jgi:guanine deaminase